MNGDFEKRLAAAVPAAWWAILIAGLWLAGGWVVLLVFLHQRPEWLRWLWGGGNLDWDTMQRMSLWIYGAMKVVLLAAVLLAIWLTLWSRRLRGKAGR